MEMVEITCGTGLAQGGMGWVVRELVGWNSVVFRTYQAK